MPKRRHGHARETRAVIGQVTAMWLAGLDLPPQRQFAHTHPCFAVERLGASSHFPMLEVPDEVASRLLAWARPEPKG